ncbi:MAG: hypothetical protein EBU46_15070 [Nitrosomonadaceae bacterium]|nr:hypothetical protein [Nitrosomonadaceae bacterium]
MSDITTIPKLPACFDKLPSCVISFERSSYDEFLRLAADSPYVKSNFEATAINLATKERRPLHVVSFPLSGTIYARFKEDPHGTSERDFFSPYRRSKNFVVSARGVYFVYTQEHWWQIVIEPK